MKYLIVSLLALSASVYAAADSRSVATADASTSAPDGSSAANRGDKTAMVTLQLAGVGPTATASQGLAVGFFANPNGVISLEGTSNENVKDRDASGTLDAKSIGLHYKAFLGNSFYLKAGGDYRMAKSNRADRAFDANSTTASVAIGNQWQWSAFTLGVDWIGYVVPLTSNIISERVASNTDVAAARAGLDDEERTYVTGNSSEFLRFYLGASF